jgi:hypothetical protein
LKCRWWWWFIEYSAWGMWRWSRHFLAQLDAHHDCFKSSYVTAFIDIAAFICNRRQPWEKAHTWGKYGLKLNYNNLLSRRSDVMNHTDTVWPGIIDRYSVTCVKICN